MEAPRTDLVRMLVRTSEVRDDSADSDNADNTNDPGTLVGDLAVFNRWAEINSWEGNFMERVAPGAFDKTIRERADQVKVTLNHGTDPELGDKPLGSVKSLRATDKAVPYEVQLFRGIPELVMDGLRAGEYGASFRFEVMDDMWEDRKGDLPRRTITEVKLFEFGPVTFPAYEAATAGIRSRADMMIWQRLPEHERADFVRYLFLATQADNVTGAGDKGSEPEPSTPFTTYRQQLERLKEAWA